MSQITTERPNWAPETFFSSHHEHYTKLLHRVLDQKPETNRSATCLSYSSLLPILRFQGAFLQDYYRVAQAAFSQVKATDEYANGLDEKSFDLRRALEGFEDSVQVFTSYIINRGDENFLNSAEYRAAKKLWVSILPMARRLETEIRDHMQLMVAKLSITESRRSIELSDTQIREGKQGTLHPIWNCIRKITDSSVVKLCKMIKLCYLYPSANEHSHDTCLYLRTTESSNLNIWYEHPTA